VHKKYTYKNGKRYGPYLYETKRVNGKIVTTYLGTASENKENKSKRTFNPLPILIIIGLILAVSFVFLYFPTEFTGRATLDVQANYEVGELITGNLNLNIKSGELIPESSMVVISLGEIVKEISLSELVSENLVEGNLYAEGFEISGDGKGFGLLGSKEIYPEVEFDLRVFDSEEVVEEVIEEVEDSEETQEEVSEGVEEGGEVQEEVVEVVEEASEESVGEEIAGESSEETPEEEILGGEVIEETEEVEEVEGAQEEVVEANEEVEEVEEVQEEVVEANEEPEETSEEESSPAPITGEVILEDGQIISGSVSYENDFVYDLLEGKSVEIVEGSLGVEEAKLDLEISNEKAKVSTEYYEVVEGFGEEFLGKDNLVLKIDISEFGLIAEENSEMKVELVYDENVLAEAEKDISVLEIVKAVNETISNQTIANVTVNTTQYGAVLGKPVKWKKKIELAEASALTIELPASAENVSIVKIVKEEESFEILEAEEVEEEKETEENDENELIVENETEEEEQVQEVIVEVDDEVVVSEVVEEVPEEVEEVVEEIEGSLTGLVTIEVSDEVVEETKNNSTKEEEVVLVEFNDSVEEVEIEYETPAPYAEEEELFDKKIVKIVGPEEVHYENVLAFTELSEDYGITNPQQIRINWIENGTYLQPQFVGDFDENGIYDYVEWVVPHLSNQTFEIIVVIRAEHLNENRTSVSDIYGEVRNLDGNWSEEIPEEHYVRVVFEKKLTSENDITIYPRIVNGTPRVEIYEIDGTELIAEFASINSEELNKIYLTSLNGEQDTFDLKIVGGSLEFDYIVDPTAYFFEDCSDVSDWSIVPIAPFPNKWKSVAGQCVCEGCIAYSNMTSATLDLSGTTSVNFTFDWDVDLSAGKHFNVSVSDDGGTTYTEVFSKIGALETTGSENITLENYISLTSSVKLKALCYAVEAGRSNPADDCIWDNINLTAYDYYNPNVTINLPATLNYSTTSFNFNVSLNENASEVMFTLNGGATNYTMVADDNRNFNYTNTSVPDGTYTFQVYANDTEGNQNYTESVVFSVDVTFPQVAIASPANNTNSTDTGLDVNFTASDTNYLQNCWYSNDTYTANYSLANCATNITSLVWSEGVHAVTVYANDSAGNVNSSSVNFTVDLTAPVISYVSPTETSGSFKSTGGVKVNVTVTDTNLKNITTTLYNSTHDSISSSTTTTSPKYNAFLTSADGIYYFNATTYDYSGNSASTSSRNVTIDTTYPTFNIVTPSNQTYTSVQSTFRPGGSDTNIDTCWYSLNDGTTNTTMTCAATIGGLDSGQGSSTWTVYANDSAGNENSSSVTFFVDSVVPLVEITIPTNNTNSSDTGIDINFTSSDTNLGSCWYSNDTYSVNYSLTNCATNVTTIKWSEGVHAVTVYANDTFGNENSSSINFTIDATLPEISISIPVNNTNSTDTGLDVNFTASDTNYLQNCWYSNDTYTANYSLASCSTNITSLVWSEGVHAVSVYANDSAGNVNSASANFTIDTTYPTFNITQPLNITYTSTQTAFGPNVADDNLDICWYSLDGGTTNTTYICLSSPIVGDSGEWSSTWTAYANDSAGNENSSSVTFFVDSVAPLVTIKSPEPNTYTTSNFVFNVTLNESGSVKFSLDGGATNYTMTPDGLVFNYSTSVSEGTYTFHAYANDTLGNQNNTENVTFIVTLPKITPSGGGGGGGGGGRGRASSGKSPKKVKVDSKGLTINIVKGEKEERTIQVTNEGDEKINMDVDVGAIGGILKPSDKSFDLSPGESRIVKVTVSDVERGLHTGEVKFVSGDYEKKVPVVVNVKSGEFLFDSAIAVDEGTRKVKRGEDVVVQIDLKQIGIEAEVDVTVTYVIKDFEGNVYLEESETFAVFDEKDFLKSIPTDDLPPGEYVVGMEVAYPGAFATASAQFKVKEKVSEFSSENLRLIVIVIALAVLILIILYFFARRKRKK